MRALHSTLQVALLSQSENRRVAVDVGSSMGLQELLNRSFTFEHTGLGY